MLLVTGEGWLFYRLGNLVDVPGFTVYNDTGAGDAVLGGVVYQVLERGKALDFWSGEDAAQSVEFANAVGALVTTKRGAIPAMPSLSEVKRLMESQRR